MGRSCALGAGPPPGAHSRGAPTSPPSPGVASNSLVRSRAPSAAPSPRRWRSPRPRGRLLLLAELARILSIAFDSAAAAAGATSNSLTAISRPGRAPLRASAVALLLAVGLEDGLLDGGDRPSPAPPPPPSPPRCGRRHAPPREQRSPQGCIQLADEVPGCGDRRTGSRSWPSAGPAPLCTRPSDTACAACQVLDEREQAGHGGISDCHEFGYRIARPQLS